MEQENIANVPVQIAMENAIAVTGDQKKGLVDWYNGRKPKTMEATPTMESANNAPLIAEDEPASQIVNEESVPMSNDVNMFDMPQQDATSFVQETAPEMQVSQTENSASQTPSENLGVNIFDTDSLNTSVSPVSTPMEEPAPQNSAETVSGLNENQVVVADNMFDVQNADSSLTNAEIIANADLAPVQESANSKSFESQTQEATVANENLTAQEMAPAAEQVQRVDAVARISQLDELIEGTSDKIRELSEELVNLIDEKKSLSYQLNGVNNTNPVMHM